MKKKNRLKHIRWILLAIFLILITFQAYLHQVKGGGEAASIHALCPYGGLESLYSLLGNGTFIDKIYSGTFVLLVLTLIMAVLFRRSFCGLLCPFGALQEFFGLIGRKIFKRKFIMPSAIDKPLRYLKYLILLLTIFYAWNTAGLWMSPYDPWAAYAHISEGLSSLLGENLIGFIILIITITGSILYDRFFCKYLCPMGAVYGIISKLSPHKIVRNKEKCINCKLCSKNCPMNIDVSQATEITSSECINCQTCVLSCPKEGCLEIKQFKKTLKTPITVSLVIIMFFSGIFLSKLAGIYNTLPAPISANSNFSIDDIKGYMTLKEISDALNIDSKNLYKKLAIPQSVSKNTKLKDVKNFVPDFTPDKAKEILSQTD